MEEDRNETQRLLAHEQSARALQEDLLNSHLRKQQDIEEKNLRNLTKSNEVMVKLHESDANSVRIILESLYLSLRSVGVDPFIIVSLH